MRSPINIVERAECAACDAALLRLEGGPSGHAPHSACWARTAQCLRVMAVPHQSAQACFGRRRFRAGVRVFAESENGGCLFSKALTGGCVPQAMNSLVTVQIATGDTNLVSNVRLNLVNDVQSGAILVRCCCARLHAGAGISTCLAWRASCGPHATNLSGTCATPSRYDAYCASRGVGLVAAARDKWELS